MARALIIDTAKNFHKQRYGAEYDVNTRDFWKVIKIWGAPKLYNFLTTNLGGPKERTVGQWITQTKHAMEIGINDGNFEFLARFYQDLKSKLEISSDIRIPCMFAEDETSIISKLSWDQSSDKVLGGCGCQCSGMCTKCNPASVATAINAKMIALLSSETTRILTNVS